MTDALINWYQKYPIDQWTYGYHDAYSGLERDSTEIEYILGYLAGMRDRAVEINDARRMANSR